MWQSFRYSQLVLRLTLGLVFVWFGIDTFINPQYWLTLWMPSWIIHAAFTVGITGIFLAYAMATFEILTAISLLANMFVGFFSVAATIFLIIVSILAGVSRNTIQDIVIIGALIALALWPHERRLVY